MIVLLFIYLYVRLEVNIIFKLFSFLDIKKERLESM